MEILSEYFDQGRIQLTNLSPIKLMPEVDIAFFDMVSTGFAEAVHIGVPTLVYRKDIDYELPSNEGKVIGDELMNCGMVFFDAKSGIQSFEKIVNDLPAFQRAARESICRFKHAVAYPVNKNEFMQNLAKNIQK